MLRPGYNYFDEMARSLTPTDTSISFPGVIYPQSRSSSLFSTSITSRNAALDNRQDKMTSTPVDEQTKQDVAVLAGLGYKQEFKRDFRPAEVFGFAFGLLGEYLSHNFSRSSYSSYLLGVVPSVAYVNPIL